MAIRPILRYPDRVLKAGTTPVGSLDDAARTLAEDLVDTMLDAPGCVGLAAPQIGSGVRAFVLDISRMRKPHPNHGRLVLFDPEIVHREGSEVRREGCASVPDYTCDIRRPTRIVIRGLDADGRPQVLEAEGFEARALQHEVDHLEGLLILDRVASLKTDVYRRKNYG